MDIYDFQFLNKIRPPYGRCWAGSAAPGGDETMPVGPSTKRVTVNVPAALAVDVEQLAQGAGLTTAAWVARILAAAVRSLKAGVTDG